MTLMESIRQFEVPRGAVTLWWLGQLSFIVKSPGGQIIALAPYLTNSCKEGAAKEGINADRLFPPLVQPKELDVDVIVFTHSHQDHCDPATITEYREAGGRGPYVATGETMEKLVSLSVPQEAIRLTWPNREHSFGDVRLKTTFAIPFGGDDVTHAGYLAFVEAGPTIYFTGDTDYHDVLGYIADYKPHLMVAVINGAYRNLGPNEAAKLTAKINPSKVIPCHYDLFPDNSLDPRLFRTSLHSSGMADKYQRLDHGQPFTFAV